MRLANKIAVVTGAASGFGFEVSQLFLTEGAIVVMADLDNERLEQQVSALKTSYPGKVESFLIDVSSESDVDRLFEETMKRHSAVDILVHAAGIWLLPKQITETTLETWNRTIDVNLKGTFLCCKHAMRRMIPRKRGSIVTFGSIMGIDGYPGDVPYCASKGGVIMLTKAAALEGADHMVRVNCVCPGTSDTPMMSRFFDAAPDKQKAIQEEISRIPLRRLGSTKEIANCVLFLSSDESSYLTGVVLPVDGGYVAQ
jgi:dihydroanticapsin dehydrogenase